MQAGWQVAIEFSHAADGRTTSSTGGTRGTERAGCCGAASVLIHENSSGCCDGGACTLSEYVYMSVMTIIYIIYT